MRRRRACGECSPYTICFAIGSCLLLLFLRVAAFEDAQDFVFSHDEVFLTIELDVLPRVLAEQDEVTGLDVERLALPVVLDLADARGDHLALLWLFLSR